MKGQRTGGRRERFMGERRVGDGGGAAEGTNLADGDIRGGVDDKQCSVSVQPQFPDDQLHNQRRTDWNKTRGSTIELEERYNQNNFNQDYDLSRRPKGNRGPRENRDHDFPDSSSDQGTTERGRDVKGQRRHQENRDFNRSTSGDFNRGNRGDFNRETRGDFNRGYRGDFNRGAIDDFSRGIKGNFNMVTRDFNHGTRKNFHQGTGGDFNRRTRGGRHGYMDVAMTETKSIDIKNEVQHEKCHLLIKLTEEISKMYGCWVYVDKAKHSVDISGRDKTAVTQTALLVHEKLSSMHSMKISIGQRFAESLCCKTGYEWIKDFLMKSDLKASYFLNQNKQLEILAENAESAEAIVLQLQNQVESYRVPYNSYQKAHLQSEDWKKFVRSAEGNWLVTIDVTDTEVCLEGVRPDFSLALNSIQYELTDNSRVTETISMVVGKLRFLQTHHPDIV